MYSNIIATSNETTKSELSCKNDRFFDIYSDKEFPALPTSNSLSLTQESPYVRRVEPPVICSTRRTYGQRSTIRSVQTKPRSKCKTQKDVVKGTYQIYHKSPSSTSTSRKSCSRKAVVYYDYQKHLPLNFCEPTALIKVSKSGQYSAFEDSECDYFFHRNYFHVLASQGIDTEVDSRSMNCESQSMNCESTSVCQPSATMFNYNVFFNEKKFSFSSLSCKLTKKRFIDEASKLGFMPKDHFYIKCNGNSDFKHITPYDKITVTIGLLGGITPEETDTLKTSLKVDHRCLSCKICSKSSFR